MIDEMHEAKFSKYLGIKKISFKQYAKQYEQHNYHD